MTQILPRFHAREQQAERARQIADITTHTDADTAHPSGTVAGATLPGDRRRLRGIPVQGAASGTSPGTDPLAALLAEEAKLDRRS